MKYKQHLQMSHFNSCVLLLSLVILNDIDFIME